MSGTAADVRNPEKLPRDDVAFIEAMTHEPVGHGDSGLWHHKGMQLPAYIQHIANDLRSQRGMTTSRAIATAVSRCKVWCAGGDGVKADTKVKACAAVAEWEALKVRSHLSSATVNAGIWSPAAHPRAPKGSPAGGEFAPGGKGGPTKAKPVQQGQGMNGKADAQVHNLQTRLQALGFSVGKAGKDGKFGPETAKAVLAFQKAHGLKEDGKVGPKTTAALRQLGKGESGTKTNSLTHKPGSKSTLAPKKAMALPAVDSRVLNIRTGVPYTVTEQVTDEDYRTLLRVTDAAGTDHLFEARDLIVSGGEPASPATGTYTMPDLVTIPGVDLLAAGSWELSTGRNTFTRKDITDAIEAAKCPAVGDPIIKLGHQDPRFDGEPAIGKVTNMRADESGTKLIGDLSDMPGWLGGIAAKAYPQRSVEGSYGFKCQTGHDHPFVLTGLALLGVTAPGVGVLNGLPDIASLYGINAAAVERNFITPPQDMEGDVVAVTEEDVRRAYYAAGGAPADWWISELQMVPTQLVVAAGDGKIYQVPFAIEGDDGAITFGAAVPIPDYAALTASRGTGRLVTYASADESRKLSDPEPPTDPKAGAADPPTLEGDNKTGDKNNASMSGDTHGAYSGTHSHPHAANGAQGTDDTHSHSHTHDGDGDHGHAHANATGADKKEGSDVEFNKEQEANLRAALGLGEDDELTPEAVLTASAALHEQAQAKVAAGKRGKLPDGVIAVEQEVWDNINRKVEAGERFRNKVLRDERDEVIDSAVRAGKFSAARAPHWKRLWDADPEGTREVLSSLKKNSVPVDDLGAGGGNLDDDAYESEYAALYPPGEFAKG